jgi:hypothetical protein
LARTGTEKGENFVRLGLDYWIDGRVTVLQTPASCRFKLLHPSERFASANIFSNRVWTSRNKSRGTGTVAVNHLSPAHLKSFGSVSFQVRFQVVSFDLTTFFPCGKPATLRAGKVTCVQLQSNFILSLFDSSI